GPRAFGLGRLGPRAVVIVPFLLAGVAVSAPLSAWPERADRLYAADLLGAALGCWSAVLALDRLDAAGALCLAAAALAAGGTAYALPAGRALAPGALAVGPLAAAPLARRVLQVRPAPRTARAPPRG